MALIPPTPTKDVESPTDNTDANEVDPADTDYLVSLLMKCYPDMPPARADALADYLPAGTYVFIHLALAGMLGIFKIIPLTASKFYFADVGGRDARMCLR